jgi:hypothetical protein
MNAERKNMLKKDGKSAQNNGENKPFELRENPRINAQIDQYIKDNSDHWKAIQAMPRDRLERHAVWQQIRYNTRRERLDNGLLRKVEENPELKRDYENLLKHVPEDQRERAKVSIARTLVLSNSRGQRQQQPPPKNAVGV